MTSPSTANLAGTPILNLTAVPQQVPIGSGCTLVNPSSNFITLSTQEIPTASSSFTLAPNGASIPITQGPLWASCTGTANLVVIPEILNIFNPNVLNAPAGGVSIGKQTFAATGYNFGINVPSGIKTLTINIEYTGANAPTNILVTGNVSGFIYRNGPPYLFSVVPFLGTIVVPVMSVDTSVEVTVTGSGGSPSTVTVTGDYDRYDENIYYNGQEQVSQLNVNTAPTLVTAVTGPARLLWITAAVNGGGNCLVIRNGLAIMNPESVAGSIGVTQSIAYPPNTLLPSGSTIQFENLNNGTFTDMAMGYAYP